MAKDELTVLEGNLSAAGLKIAVVCARFNEFFVQGFNAPVGRGIYFCRIFRRYCAVFP